MFRFGAWHLAPRAPKLGPLCSHCDDRMKSRVWLLLLGGAWAAGAAHADIYKCVDPVSGKVTYTNTRAEATGCTLLSRDLPISTVPGGKSGRRPARGASASSPNDFPRVDANAQKSRDSDRRKILDTELATEEKALEEARKELAEQESLRSGNEKNYARVQERLKSYQDRVELHERNITAIRKEIDNTR